MAGWQWEEGAAYIALTPPVSAQCFVYFHSFNPHNDSCHFTEEKTGRERLVTCPRAQNW